MADSTLNPVGYVIEDYEVRGQERDSERHWVGADMELSIPPIGRFLLNIVTKGHYSNEQLKAALNDADHPELLLDEPSDLERKEPFVLNDSEITDDVLHRKFGHRTVEQDLADSLWYLGPVD